MRDCPTVQASSIPLIIHRIAVDECMSRQTCNYHKCHRCVYRGKATNWEPEGGDLLPRVQAPRTGERAVPSKTVEVKGKEPAPARSKSARGKPAAKP